MTNDSRQFVIAGAVTGRKINQRLPKGSKLKLCGSEPQSGMVLDTFDGILAGQGKLLILAGTTLICADVQTAKTDVLELSSAWNRFAETLPECDLKDHLVRLTALRLLFPVGEVDVLNLFLPLLDEEKKTCCRLSGLIISQEKQSLSFLQTHAMRGYDAYHQQLIQALDGQTGGAAPEYHEILTLETSGYSAKPEIRLEPDAPVFDSLRLLVTTYLNVARKNEEGVIADYDTEFLHDYRVSLRKIRSVLSLFKNVLSEEDTAHLKQSFSEIMKETNLLRDRDVYLLSKPDYFSMVPPRLHRGLETLFEMLEEERNRAHQAIRRMLKSQDYQNIMSGLENWFGPDNEQLRGEFANAPSKKYGCGLIMKRYRKVCRIAKSITVETPDETIHELRIQCKKLRYLIESFAPLFPKKQIKTLLKKLKRMQEHLGLFNDRSVQQVSLEEFMNNHTIRGKKGLRLAESIGALTSMLYSEQLRERDLIVANLAAFGSPETRTAFNNLFMIGENDK
ncbi:CHAD domain-containing protein [Pontiellaceae bacterium B1224]|nr:CHAD domain-containing protein [Pontiellaceae bacterium B1224]